MTTQNDPLEDTVTVVHMPVAGHYHVRGNGTYKLIQADNDLVPRADVDKLVEALEYAKLIMENLLPSTDTMGMSRVLSEFQSKHGASDKLAAMSGGK